MVLGVEAVSTEFKGSRSTTYQIRVCEISHRAKGFDSLVQAVDRPACFRGAYGKLS